MKTYEEALDILVAEYHRLYDQVEKNLEEQGLDDFQYGMAIDLAGNLVNQTIWTIAMVYGMDYEEVEGDFGDRI